MRFEALHIERYGVFEERSLNFGQAPLTVIYGPNEAGKSTTLEAVGDFLFGVPVQTPRMGVYGGDVLRLGASLTTAGGGKLNLWRRKGRGKTLTNETGSAVDDAVLGALLGSTTRERFQTLFGLDHETLRQGGAELLSADGDFGRLIVEAGGGLRGLISRLDQVDEDLAGLFTNRRHGDRAFYRASDAFVEAERIVKDDSITWDQYEKGRKGHEEAVAAVQRLREARGAATRMLSHLERLVRVVPTLGRLDQVREALAALGDDAGLPSDFDEQVAVARRRLEQAQEALAEDTRQRARLQDTLADLPVDASFQSLEAKVRDIRERTIHVTKQRVDRPNRERELADADGRLNALRRRLGLTPTADLSSKLPSVEAVDTVVVLGGQGQRLEPELSGAITELERLQARHRQLSIARDEAVAAGHDEAVGITADQLALLPSVEGDLAVRERQAKAALAAARLGMTELGLNSDRPDAVAFPDRDQVAEQISQLDRLHNDRGEADRDLRRAESERDVAVRSAERLTAGGDVADTAALEAAREARTAALEPLRRSHLAGVSNVAPEVRAREMRQLDLTIAGADDLADRLSNEAQRAAELSQARHRAQENDALAKAAERSISSLNQEITRRTLAFQANYPEASERFPTLPSLMAAAERRRVLIEQARQAAAALEEIERQRVLFVSQRQLLDEAERACRLGADPDLSLEARVRRAVKALTRHAEGHTAFARDKRELAEIDFLQGNVAKQVETLEQDRGTWRVRWTRALAALGLPAEVIIDDAIAGANEWAAAAGVLTTLDTTRRRLERMAEDEAELDAWVTAVFERVAVERPADTVAAAKMLEARWDQHQEADRKRQALEPELKLAESHEKEHAGQVEGAETELTRLAGLAAVDQSGLDNVCETLKRRRDLTYLEAQLLDGLQSSGDGLSETALRSDWGGRDVDELRAALTIEKAKSDGVDSDLETAVQQEATARSHMEAQSRTPEGAAIAAREAALAEIHDVVERYTKLFLARHLVETAISKVRAAQQDPLIIRAGTIFATLSKGAFTDVAADVDVKGSPVVVGVTATGRTTPVAMMSDGTRDQLYLAFRLAGIEAYCQSAEPLPFVADDILVHFDDERTEATLEVLSEFGKVTQVLLFTHHLSVLEAAKVLARRGGIEIVQLARA